MQASHASWSCSSVHSRQYICMPDDHDYFYKSDLEYPYCTGWRPNLAMYPFSPLAVSTKNCQPLQRKFVVLGKLKVCWFQTMIVFNSGASKLTEKPCMARLGIWRNWVGSQYWKTDFYSLFSSILVLLYTALTSFRCIPGSGVLIISGFSLNW